MGYLFIFIALISGTAKGYCGKKISNSITTEKQSIFINAVRMIFCLLIGFVILLPEIISGSFVLDVEAIAYGTMAGITLSAFLVTWLLAVKHGAFMLISVTQMFGVVVTLVCSFLVFSDPILPRQMIAIALLIVAVIIMASYSTKLKGSLSIKAIILLVLCGLSSGLYDFSLKLFTHFSSASVSTLNLFSYLVAAVVLGAIFLFCKDKNAFDAKKMLYDTGIVVIVMSICLFVNSYFKALANNYIPPAQLYPIYQAGGLIFSALMSMLFFKEKITPRCILGLIIAFVSILLLK
jgi:drug/metabolite transporter (DMT)-like permease